MMLQIGQFSLLIYAGLLLVGGMVGYAKAGSKISLISGIGSSVLAVAGFGLSYPYPVLGLSLGLILGLILTLVFIQRYRKTQAFMPAGMMSVLSGLAAVVTGLALFQPGT